MRNPAKADAMRGWGGYELGPRLTLSLRARELVIDRTCARCGCEYEWGGHVAVFRERAGLDAAQVASLTHGSPDDPCWSDPSERCLIRLVRAVDELHDGSTIGEATWSSLSASFRPDQLPDITLLAGWCHAISYAANAADVELEPWAPRSADVAATSGP